MNFLPQFSACYDKSEDFDCYMERFELFIVANGLHIPTDNDTAEQQANNTRVNFVATLLKIDRAAFLRSCEGLIVSPAKPSDKKYGELKTVLRKHFKRTPVTVAERRKFLRRDHGESQSLSDYVVQLKHLSLHYNYADKLDENLRDRIISGLKSDLISLKLMEKASDDPTMTFQAAVDFALAREVAAGEARAMRAGSTSAQGRAGPGNTSVHSVYGKHKGSYAKQSSNRAQQIQTMLSLWEPP